MNSLMRWPILVDHYNVNVKYDPNSSMSFKMVRDDGQIWTVDVVGVTVIDPNKMETKFEGFIDVNNGGSNSTGKDSYNRNLPVKNITLNDRFVSKDFGRNHYSINSNIQKSKFDKNNRMNFYNLGYNHSIQLNNDGKLVDYKEQDTGKTKNMDMLIYHDLGYAKRKEMVTKIAEINFKAQSSEARNFSIDILNYNYNLKLNDFGVLTHIKKTEYQLTDKNMKAFINQKKELSKKGIKTESDIEKYLISFTNAFFNNYEKNKNRVKQLEKDTLLDTSAIIVDSGEKISTLLGQEYKAISDRIANDVKNFQGKKIRSFNDALKDLDKVLKNPNFKVSKQDSAAIANAAKQINAKTLSDNFYRLGKAFKVLDVSLKIEKIREKTVEGFNTGNWNPLMLEVEAMILSGYTASLALSIAFSVIGTIATILSLGALPVALASIAAIILISYMSSLIDADLVDKINKTLIRPAH